MYRHLMTAGLLLLFTGCSDTFPTPTAPVSGPVEQPVLQTIPGILEARNLLRSGESLIVLSGWQTDYFEDLIGAEVLVYGTYGDEERDLIIQDFRVLAVDGVPALDGMLGLTEEGFVIDSGGNLGMLDELTEDLTNYVGERVWITMQDGKPVRYGTFR